NTNSAANTSRRATPSCGRDRSTPGGSGCAKIVWTCSRPTVSTSCSTRPTAASGSGRRSKATARFWCATAISLTCATPNGCRAADDGALSRPLAAAARVRAGAAGRRPEEVTYKEGADVPRALFPPAVVLLPQGADRALRERHAVHAAPSRSYGRGAKRRLQANLADGQIPRAA